MITTLTGLVAGTATLFSTATALQPMNVTRTDTNNTVVYIAKAQHVHMTGTSKLNIIIDDGNSVSEYDGHDSIDFDATKGQKIYINAETGFTSATYKIGNQKITVPANPLIK